MGRTTSAVGGLDGMGQATSRRRWWWSSHIEGRQGAGYVSKVQVPLITPASPAQSPTTVLDQWQPPLRPYAPAQKLDGYKEDKIRVLVDFEWEHETDFGPHKFPRFKVVAREVAGGCSGKATVIITKSETKGGAFGEVEGRSVFIYQLGDLRNPPKRRLTILPNAMATDEDAVRSAGTARQSPTIAQLISAPEQAAFLTSAEARGHLPTVLGIVKGLVEQTGVDLTGVDLRSISTLFALLAQRGLSVEEAEAAMTFLNVSPELRQRWLALNLLVVQEDLADHLLENDIVALGRRKRSLAQFERMLDDENDAAYFDALAEEAHGPERAWQRFFENNTWIFGYSFHYGFFAPVGRRLETTVLGGSEDEDEKRADALLQSAGHVRFSCFVEIKPHRADLLGAKYRSGCFAPSADLSGAVAQVQGTATAAVIRKHGRITELNDARKTVAYVYVPRCVVVIGHTVQLDRDEADARARSFEVYRRQMVNPEVITYDELYHRAKNIVEHVERARTGLTQAPSS